MRRRVIIPVNPCLERQVLSEMDLGVSINGAAPIAGWFMIEIPWRSGWWLGLAVFQETPHLERIVIQDRRTVAYSWKDSDDVMGDKTINTVDDEKNRFIHIHAYHPIEKTSLLLVVKSKNHTPVFPINPIHWVAFLDMSVELCPEGILAQQKHPCSVLFIDCNLWIRWGVVFMTF